MSKPNIFDGGPAFPGLHPSGDCKYQDTGMALRDWLAGQALAGMMADQQAKGAIRNSVTDSQEFAPAIARVCYLLADAMLAEREGRQ